MDNHKHIRIGTRNSPLAITQTNIIIKNMELNENEYSIVPVVSSGDKISGYLRNNGGKNLFSKELHQQLFENKIDIAVHSLKDLETPLPEGLEIACFSKRENPQDLIIFNNSFDWPNINKEINIGTSSLRRERFLNFYLQNKPYKISLCRGNIQTRLENLKKGKFDAIVLAAAGLIRSHLLDEGEIKNMPDFSCYFFDSDLLLPSSGQGVLAIVKRIDDDRFNNQINKVNDSNVQESALIERDFLNKINASCHDPLGVFAIIKDNIFELNVMFFDNLVEPLRINISGNIKNKEELINKFVKDFKKACEFRKTR